RHTRSDRDWSSDVCSSDLRIRKISTNGTITTVAGNGFAGFSGDGGPAVSATLRDPRDVAVDPAGNLYIADLGNERIRKVDTAGKIGRASCRERGERRGVVA